MRKFNQILIILFLTIFFSCNSNTRNESNLEPTIATREKLLGQEDVETYKKEIENFCEQCKEFWISDVSKIIYPSKLLNLGDLRFEIFPRDAEDMNGEEITITNLSGGLFLINYDYDKAKLSNQIDVIKTRIYFEIFAALFPESNSTSFDPNMDMNRKNCLSTLFFDELKQYLIFGYFINKYSLIPKNVSDDELHLVAEMILHVEDTLRIDSNLFYKTEELLEKVLSIPLKYDFSKDMISLSTSFSDSKNVVTENLESISFDNRLKGNDFIEFLKVAKKIKNRQLTLKLFDDFNISLKKGDLIYQLLLKRIEDTKSKIFKSTELIAKLSNEFSLIEQNFDVDLEYFDEDEAKDEDEDEPFYWLGWTNKYDQSYFNNIYTEKEGRFTCKTINKNDSKLNLAFSSILWYQFSYLRKKTGKPFVIKTIKQESIENEITLNVISTLLQSAISNEVIIDANSTAGKAILGTPNGKSSLWLSHDFLEEMNYCIPSKIHVSQSNLLIEFEKVAF